MGGLRTGGKPSMQMQCFCLPVLVACRLCHEARAKPQHAHKAPALKSQMIGSSFARVTDQPIDLRSVTFRVIRAFTHAPGM